MRPELVWHWCGTCQRDSNAQVNFTLEIISVNYVSKMDKIHTSLLLPLFTGCVDHHGLINCNSFGDKYGHRGYNRSCTVLEVFIKIVVMVTILDSFGYV